MKSGLTIEILSGKISVHPQESKTAAGDHFLFVVVSGLDLIGLGMMIVLSLIASPDRPLPACLYLCSVMKPAYQSVCSDHRFFNRDDLCHQIGYFGTYFPQGYFLQPVSADQIAQMAARQISQLPYEDFIRKTSNHYINAIQNYLRILRVDQYIDAESW